MRISDWSSDVCSSDLGFYAIGSSRPIGDIVDERTAAIFELGLSNLSMSPTGFSEAKTLERFENGLIDLYRRQGLFYQNTKAVELKIGRASCRERVCQYV